MPRIHIESNGVGTRPGTISGGNVRVNDAAFGAQVANSRMNQKALHGLNQQLEALSMAVTKKEEDDDNLRRLNAENEYNRQIGDLKGEIEEQRRLGNAQDVTRYFVEQEEKIRKEVYGNSGIKYKRTEQAFNLNAERLAIADTDRIQSFENDQVEKYQVVTLDNNIKNYIKTGIQTGKIDDIASSSASIRENVQAIYGKYGSEVVEAKTREALTELTSAATYNKASLGDTDGALEVINFMSPFVDDQKIAKLVADLNETKKTDTQFQIANKAIAENSGRFLSFEEYQRQYGSDAQEYVLQSGEHLSKEHFLDVMLGKISDQETGGSSNAYTTANATGSGAYGKYQIMGDNWGTWSAEAGYAGASPSNPEAQEATARHKQGQYYEAYRKEFPDVSDRKIAEAIAVAWYAGPENGRRWLAGKPDAIGEGGHYSWDAIQTGVNAGPSVKQYVQESLGNSFQSGVVNEKNRAKTPTELRKEYEVYRTTFAQQENYKKQKKQEAVDSFGDSVLNRIVALGENPTAEQTQSVFRTVQQEIIQISNGDSELYTALTGKAGLLLKRYEKAGELPKATEKQKWALKREAALGSLGSFKSEEHLVQAMDQSGLDFGNDFGSAIDSWRKGTQGKIAETAEAAAIAVGIPEKYLNSPTGKNLLGQGVIYLQVEEQNSGRSFTQDERNAILQGYFKKNSIALPGTGAFGFLKDTLEYSKAELNQIGIDTAIPMEYDGLGNRTDGLISVRYSNGQYGTMSVNELQERLKAARGEESTLVY